MRHLRARKLKNGSPAGPACSPGVRKPVPPYACQKFRESEPGLQERRAANWCSCMLWLLKQSKAPCKVSLCLDGTYWTNVLGSWKTNVTRLKYVKIPCQIVALFASWCFHALLWNVPNRHRPASRAGQWQWLWHKWLPARLQGDEGSLHSHSLLHTDHTVPFRTTPHPASHPLLQGDPDRDHQKIDTLA